MSTSHDFRGATVLVTGAAQGIGEGICAGFLRAGAQVWGSDVDAAGLASATQRLMDVAADAMDPPRDGVHGAASEPPSEPVPPTFRSRVVDVTDPEAVDGWVRAALAETGRVDVLVHVAGGVLGQVEGPVEEVTDEAWRAILAVNLDGAFHAARAVAPAMKEAGSGRIVVISSGAGLKVSLTGLHAYASAKSAQLGLVRQLAHELGSFGITVNAVAPGFVRSNPSTERQWDSYGAEGQARLLEGIAMKRLGRPEDIAAAVLYFASAEAGWVTGQTLPVDGGR